MSERTFRRRSRRFEEEGEEGLLDRRLGRRSGRAVPEEAADEVERLYRERYAGFTAKHFHEHLAGRHGFRWGYTWTKTYLQARGLLAKAPRRGAHRRKRPRRQMAGMMLHQDASRHAWLEGSWPLDLVVTLDDATSEIYSAFLVEEETASSFRALIDTIAAKEHIAAYSPEPRGRSERASGPCRIACPRSWPWPASGTSRRPTPSSARCICQPTTLASPRCRPTRKAPSCRWRRRNGATSSASTKSASSRQTIRSPGTAGACRFRPIRRGLISCAPRSGSITTGRRNRDLPWAKMLGPMASHSGEPEQPSIVGRMSLLGGPPNAADGMDKAHALLTPPTAEQNQKSGHSMCYINRTTSEPCNSRVTAEWRNAEAMAIQIFALIAPLPSPLRRPLCNGHDAIPARVKRHKGTQ